MSAAGPSPLAGMRRWLDLGRAMNEALLEMSQRMADALGRVRMDRYEWLNSADPVRMLAFAAPRPGRPGGIHFAEAGHTFRPSQRRLRLLACAIFSAKGGGTWHPDSDWALAVAENHADGYISDAELRRAHEQIDAGLAAEYLLRPHAGEAVLSLARNRFVEALDSFAPERRAAADLVREVLGDPWEGRGPFAWPAGVEPGVREMAQAAYEARDWGLLPLLADALEHAGCDDRPILRHLRGQMPCPSHDPAGACPVCGGEGWVPLRATHVRGCWALDAVLGKE